MPISQVISRFHNLVQFCFSAKFEPLSIFLSTIYSPTQQKPLFWSGHSPGMWKHRIQSLHCSPLWNTALGSRLFPLQLDPGQLHGWSLVELHPFLTKSFESNKSAFLWSRSIFLENFWPTLICGLLTNSSEGYIFTQDQLEFTQSITKQQC